MSDSRPSSPCSCPPQWSPSFSWTPSASRTCGKPGTRSCSPSPRPWWSPSCPKCLPSQGGAYAAAVASRYGRKSSGKLRKSANCEGERETQLRTKFGPTNVCTVERDYNALGRYSQTPLKSYFPQIYSQVMPPNCYLILRFMRVNSKLVSSLTAY